MQSDTVIEWRFWCYKKTAQWQAEDFAMRLTYKLIVAISRSDSGYLVARVKQEQSEGPIYGKNLLTKRFSKMMPEITTQIYMALGRKAEILIVHE